MSLYTSTYKDIPCLTLENDQLKAVFLPQKGGKMASLVNKRSNRELLWQNAGETYISSQYDTLFEAGDFSGFDEMFPSISECFYPGGPWYGTKIPDHGEVWSIPWEYAIEDNVLHMWTYGVKFPYRFDKWVKFSGDHIIHTDYRVMNLSTFTFGFIWAAHPLFHVTENTQIILPDSVKEIINVYGGRERLGRYGKIHPWPSTVDEQGRLYHLNKVYPNEQKHCEKYYVLGELKEGWCVLHDQNTGELVGMTFPVDKVPYLGMWVNEGGYMVKQYNVAPEPCTGAYDRLDLAKHWGCMTEVAGKSNYEWFLKLTVGKAQTLKGLDEQGEIISD